MFPDKVPCPQCGETDHIGCNPARGLGSDGKPTNWYRCWTCMLLWDYEGKILENSRLGR